jgi:hypothetical protein
MIAYFDNFASKTVTMGFDQDFLANVTTVTVER